MYNCEAFVDSFNHAGESMPPPPAQHEALEVHSAIVKHRVSELQVETVDQVARVTRHRDRERITVIPAEKNDEELKSTSVEGLKTILADISKEETK